MYNFPLEFWGDLSLDCIRRSLGTLLEIDESIIEQDSYLYVRIKLAAVKEILEFIFLKVGDMIWKQHIEVEVPTLECMRCGL